MNAGIIVELLLTIILAVTLVYCIVLERRLATVRRGQDGLKLTIRELGTAITNAGASMRALKAAASGAAETLDDRLAQARAAIDELSVLTASGERIADRFDLAATRVTNPDLPSKSIIGRLDALRAVR